MSEEAKPRRRLGESSLSLPALVLTVLAALHLAFSLSINPPGYLTWDSGTYHYMAKTFAETGSFFVWNGYEEYPAEALEVGQLKISGDHLVAQYPELLSVLVYPLYRLFGYHGLLLLEAITFPLICFLIFVLARTLFPGRRSLGYLAIGVYTFATFAWEYSQSSYPHLISTFFIVLAFTLLARALFRGGEAATGTDGETPRHPWLCGAAGLAAGLAIGLRLDSAFALPGLFAPFLFLRPIRWRDGMAMALGLLPGLAFLSWTNWVKFGVFFPFSYGSRDGLGYTGNLAHYLPIAAAIGLLVPASAMLFRAPLIWRRRALGIFGVAGLVAVVVFPMEVLAPLRRLASGIHQIVIDLRAFPLRFEQPGLTRSPGRAMVYMGGVKKALIQSCPYLVLLPFALFDAVRKRRDLARVAYLWVVPVLFVGFYAYLAWHGSVALNMRYLNPILPFTSVLTALLLDDLRQEMTPRLAIPLAAVGFLLLWFHLVTYRFTMLEREIWFLDVPLAIAAGLLLLEGLRRTRLLPTLGGPLVAYGLVFALVWSGAQAFGRDYPASARVRSNNLLVSQVIEPFLHDDILVLTDYPDICWYLIDRFDKLRVGSLLEGSQASFEGLVRFHLGERRDVYLATSAHGAQRILQGGVLSGFEVEMINSWQSGNRPTLVLMKLHLSQEGRR